MPASAGGADRRSRQLDRIVRVGLTLFDRDGFEKVTVEQIAAAAEVSPISIYRWFGTKDQLVLATRASAVDELRALARVHGAQADARRATVRTLLAFAQVERDNELWELRSRIISRSPHLQVLALGSRRDFEVGLIEQFESMPQPGPGLSTRVAAAAGLSAFHLAVREWRDGRSPSLQEAAAHALATLWPDLHVPPVQDSSATS